MKKIITNLKKMSLGIFALVLFTSNAKAITYTATQSGNWSSALTWGGAGSPGGTVGTVDNVVIPLGITVTLDMNVTVSSLASYINVAGSLTSTTNSLIITQGALQGTGMMNMSYVEIGSLGSLTFSGTLSAERFVNSGASITITGGIIINDSLILNSGSVAFSAGSTLNMNSNSHIKVNAGSMNVSGGVLSATSNYDVIYVGSSKTSGVETGISTGLHNVWVNLTDSTQILTMGSDITVTGTMYHTLGRVVIGAHTLKLMSDYIATTSGKIQSIATSRLMLDLSTTTTTSVTLIPGSQFQYLEINLATSPSATFYGNFSVDTVNMKNGSAGFANTLTMASNGVYIWEGGSFGLGTGTFVGTNSYSVIYKGGNKISAYETTGSGLQNVMVDMASNTNMVSFNSNLTIPGMLDLNKGSLDLNSHKLYLTGSFSGTANGTFRGNTSSSLFLNNTSTAFGDTLYFAGGVDYLDTLSINIMASTWVWLGNGLNLNNLVFKSGSLMITNGDLMITSPGVITGYDSTKYVGTGGLGSLVMTVNVAAPYVKFPVGTNVDYSPASLQIMAGTAGLMHVNTKNGMWSNGTGGTNLALAQSVVNRTWNIQATQTGTLNVNLQTEWKASDEVNGFDRTHSFISHYIGTPGWDATTIGSASLANGTYRQMTRPNLTSFGSFAVVDQNATTTGINKVVDNNMILELYPNPTSDFAIIDFKDADAKFIEVYNEIGSKVYSTEITSKNTAHKIDTSNLPAGVYFVKVSTTTNPIIKKLIKS